MDELAGDACFAEEALQSGRLLTLRVIHDLDRHGAAELGVPALVDDAHPTAANLTNQAVAVAFAETCDRFLSGPDKVDAIVAATFRSERGHLRQACWLAVSFLHRAGTRVAHCLRPARATRMEVDGGRGDGCLPPCLRRSPQPAVPA